MSITINENGLQSIQDFLVTNHVRGKEYDEKVDWSQGPSIHHRLYKHSIYEMIEAWASEVEESYNNNGGTPSLELKSRDNKEPYTITLEFDEAEYDLVRLKDD
tara:strand:- start:1431 stop:1739 length:309 start_codon:yes stop_codon:yes gene_type:complete